MEPELLYRKVANGKRITYLPAVNYVDWTADHMKPGQFRLIYASSKNGRRYEYNVTPDTAGFHAACLIAREAMESKILESAKPRPHHGQFTKKQKAVLSKCREMMIEAGVLLPEVWQSAQAREISQSAIDEVLAYRP